MKQHTPTAIRVALIAGMFLLAMIWLNTALVAAPHAPAACTPPAVALTPEPLWVDPINSPTRLLTQTVQVRLGRGRAITVSSEAGTVDVTGTFQSSIRAGVTTPLLSNTTHHLTVYGLVEYAPECFYTLSTWQDVAGGALIIEQQSALTPTAYLPLVMRGTSSPILAGCAVFQPDNP